MVAVEAIGGQPLSRRSALWSAFHAGDTEVRRDEDDHELSVIFVRGEELCRVHWTRIVKEPEELD